MVGFIPRVTSMTSITWVSQYNIVIPTHKPADDPDISGRDNLEHEFTVLETEEYAPDPRSCLMTMIMRQ
eukprot:12907774-Prorocentrum_lima.AAC.1